MQKYKIEISDLAEQDLEFAADYIAFDLKNPSAAVNTVQGIRKQINKLQNFPERNELDDDPVLAGLGVRMVEYKIISMMQRYVIVLLKENSRIY